MSKTKLLPCPFCGAIPKPHPDYENAYNLIHRDSCWFVHHRLFDKRSMLWDSLSDFESWNRRASSAARRKA